MSLQVIKDTVENESKYDWFQFTGETASSLGFESRDALTKVAQECEELEVNSFYGAVRFKPTHRVRNVEVGRVGVVTYGKHYGKTGVITDVVDQARVVLSGVDGTLSDIKPQSFPIKRLHLTASRVPGLTQRGHRTKKVKALLEASIEEVQKLVHSDRIMKQIQKRRAKVTMSDFDRFKAWAQKKGL